MLFKVNVQNLKDMDYHPTYVNVIYFQMLGKSHSQDKFLASVPKWLSSFKLTLT